MKQKTRIAIGLVIVLLALGGAWWAQRGGSAEVQYRTGKIERGDLLASVAASGAVTPVSLVTVGTQVSGQIRDVFAFMPSSSELIQK